MSRAQSNAGPNPQRRAIAILIGTLVAGCVIVLAAIGYEHIMDNLGLYEWQRLDQPSRRTIPFVVGLGVVCTCASFSGIWVARGIWNASGSEPASHRERGPS